MKQCQGPVALACLGNRRAAGQRLLLRVVGPYDSTQSELQEARPVNSGVHSGEGLKGGSLMHNSPCDNLIVRIVYYGPVLGPIIYAPANPLMQRDCRDVITGMSCWLPLTLVLTQKKENPA